MKLFLSWSGEPSRTIAQAFRQLVDDVFGATVTPWISTDDISLGADWHGQVGAEVEVCEAGVSFITKANQSSPWLLYEAGSIGGMARGKSLLAYCQMLWMSGSITRRPRP